MPSIGKKDLCLARSVGELNNLAQVQDKITKNANPKPWLNSAEKVFKKAEYHDTLADEENAYIFFMRFFNIMQEVAKTTKYQQDKKFYSSLVGIKTRTKAIDKAEKLAASLTERYKQLELETKEGHEKERMAKEKEKLEKDMENKDMNGKSDTLKDIDDLLNGKKPSAQTSAEVFKKLQVKHSSILSPNDSSADNKDPLTQSPLPIKLNHSPVINPVRLYELLNDVKTAKSVLILDTRSKKDFECSRMNYSCCINVPDDLLKTCVSVGSIERKLPKTTWDQWIERGHKRHLVILDLDSEYKDITADSKVQCLKDAIYLYDSSCSLLSEPLFLEGGFEAWQWHYPSLVTNPKLPEKVLPIKEENTFNLDSLTYPELPVSPKKPPSPPSPVTHTPDKPLDGRIQSTNHKDPTIGGLPLNGDQFNKFYPQSLPAAMPGSFPSFNGETPNHSVPNLSTNIPLIPVKPKHLNPGYSTPRPSTTPPSSQQPPSNQRPPPKQPTPYQNNLGVIDPSQAAHSIPSTRSQPTTVTPSETHLIQIPSQSVMNQVLHPSQQLLQPGHPNPAVLGGQLQAFGDKVSNQPEAGSSLPGNTMVQPPSSSPQSPHEADPRVQPVSMATPSTTLPPKPNTATANYTIPQGPSNAPPGLPVTRASSPPSIHPPSIPTSQHPNPLGPNPNLNTTPPSDPSKNTISTIPQVPSLSSTQPMILQVPFPSSTQPIPHVSSLSSTQPMIPHVPSPSSTQPIIPRVPSPSSAQPMIPQVPFPSSTQPIPHVPSPSSAQPMIPQVPSPSSTQPIPHVPSPSSAHPMIPQIPQTFTGSRTGMTHGLPPGWERVLDRRTGRYYFRDHNMKTTHWNLPASLAQTMNQSIMGQGGGTPKDTEAKKTSLKRSLSSPNLAKLDSVEQKENVPKSRPSVNRRTKPLSESQLSNLDPAQGGKGRALTGLRNLGNSCYMNSVLQCLMATAPLIKYILNSFYVEDINKTNPLGTGGRIAEELAVLTRVAHSGSYRHVSPVDFKRTIGRFAPHFGGHQQQDSQEFLLFLLDQFHEDTNRVIKKTYIEDKSNEGLPDSVAAGLAWDNHKKRNRSIIVELLQGQFKSTLTCSVCYNKSVTFDAFMSLTLPIPTNGSCQIEDCIRLFTTKEKVSKDNKWFCPKCKQHREAWKTMEIWKLPPILIVHFNRFKRDYDGSWLEKRQTNVNFPLDNFDMSRFLLSPKKSSPYNLYAVSNHYGSMQSGHYTAFCKNIYDKKWYKFDDSDVTQMSESNTRSSAAYILCYTSVDFAKQ